MDFLLEIGTEEIPARMIDTARTELGHRVGDLLVRERLVEQADLETLSTPRRLAPISSGTPMTRIWRVGRDWRPFTVVAGIDSGAGESVGILFLIIGLEFPVVVNAPRYKQSITRRRPVDSQASRGVQNAPKGVLHQILVCVR